MSKNARKHDLITMPDSKSSIFEKTDATLREQLNRAIVNRDPPTYQAVFDKFELAARDISFTAFYCYARRIRNTAALVEIIRARPDGAPDADTVLSEVLAERLLEAALDESASPRAIERLSHAYRAAARLKLDRRRLDAQIGDLEHAARSKETDRFCEMANQVGKLRAAELHELRERTAMAIDRIKADPHYRDEELEEKLHEEHAEIDEVDDEDGTE
jgi:hypothetical protein